MSNLNNAINILKKIESYGYEAYIIGGAVRDYLLGVCTNDYDITTNMPLEMLSSKFNVIDNGSDYASVTIVSGDETFEITHFRRDIEYRNHRHPIVELVDNLKEDVKRRDFTINAMAFDSNMKLYDFYNGMNDLNDKVIRTIGDPYIRFEEDALRILRGLHFTAKLGFSIENDTLNAMNDKKQLLSYLSDERIKDYFINIAYSKTNKGIEYIKDYDLFKYIPKYKKMLEIFNKNIDKNDLDIYYYLSYNEYPPLITNEKKKLLDIAKELIDNRFDNYSLYKYQIEINSLFNVFKALDYDIIEIRDNLDNLRLKSDSELALSKANIAAMFEGDLKSIAIKEVIRAILDGRLDNNKEEILLFLKGLEVVKC